MTTIPVLMSSTDDEQVSKLAGGILDYLNTHPSAVDTAEGITRWWLGLEAHDRNCKSVESALSVLIEESQVERIVKADGQAIYRRIGPRGTP